MRKHLLITTIAAAALAVSACSGDGGTGPGGDGNGTLSASELAQLNEAILGVSAGVRSRGGGRFSTAPAAQSNGSLTFNFDETAPCHPGGNVGVAGGMGVAWDDDAQTGSIYSEFAVDHNACGHQLDNGEVITLSGDPDIDVTLDVETGPTGFETFLIRETGAFNWSKGGGVSGRCTLDVTAELDAVTGEVELSGSFCGMNVTGTFDQD